MCRSEVVAGWFPSCEFFLWELFLTFKAASMFHHAVDVVLELHPASGETCAHAPATVMRARLVSPFARNCKLPDATWELQRNMGLYVWHLLTGPRLQLKDFGGSS